MSLQFLLVVCIGLLVQHNIQATSECRHGWAQHGNSCYFLHKDALNWEMAKVVCDALDSHMVMIEDQTENTFLADLLTSEHVERAWIGLQDIVVEGEFVWNSNQEPPQYTNWDTDNPSNSYNGEDCGEIIDDGHWNDAPCEIFKRAAFCESTATDTTIIG